MKSWDIIGYAYKADIYCPGCIVGEVLKYNKFPKSYSLDYVSTEGDLKTIARSVGIIYSDHDTYDTDDFPKAILAQDTDALEDSCCICHEKLVD